MNDPSGQKPVQTRFPSQEKGERKRQREEGGNNGKRKGDPAAPPLPPAPQLTASSPEDRSAVRQFLEAVPLDAEVEVARRLVVSHKSLTRLPVPLAKLLPHLRALDVSHNAFGAADLPLLSHLTQLSNLNLSHNPHLGTLKSLERCEHLVVLSVAHCGLCSLDGIEGSAATLKTLIANDNELSLFAPGALHDVSPQDFREHQIGVECYKALQTIQTCEVLVLSRNPRLCALYDRTLGQNRDEAKRKTNDAASSMDTEERQEEQLAEANTHPLSVLARLPKLRKVSMSECHLQSLPARLFLPVVTELRLSHNALTSLQPESVIARSLHFLDISHNELTEVATLRRCKFLEQVNLRGNPLFEACVKQDTERGFQNASRLPPSLKRVLLHLFPKLKRIDGVAAEEPDPPRDEPPAVTAAPSEAPWSSAPTVAQEKEFKELKETPVQTASAVLDEADRLDVVLEEVAVPAPSATPVVRRERHHLTAGQNGAVRVGKKTVHTGSAAVSQVLERKQLFQGGW